MENSSLSGLFNLEDKDVKVLCSRRVFERGLGYFREGRVSNTQVHGLTLRGEVEGSEPRNYKVKIEYEREGRLITKCTSMTYDSHDTVDDILPILLGPQ